jgi:hypothetical protein
MPDIRVPKATTKVPQDRFYEDGKLKVPVFTEYINLITYEINTGQDDEARKTLEEFKEIVLDPRKNSLPADNNLELRIEKFSRQLDVPLDAAYLRKKLFDAEQKIDNMKFSVEQARDKNANDYTILLKQFKYLREGIIQTLQE